MILGDYSDRSSDPVDHRIDAAQWRAAGYDGALRYLHKRNASSVAVLVTSEVQDFTREGFQFAPIYEDGAAGWMLGGAAAGRDRALWALRQARAVGFEPRCIYFADDGPRSSEADIGAVLACLMAARSALASGGTLDGTHEPAATYGPDVAGIYAFRAVMQRVANANLTRYRWLTGSKPTAATVADLGLSAYQRNYGGPYAVAGVSVDASDTFTTDWGQLPPPNGSNTGEFRMDTEVKAAFEDLKTTIHHDAGQIIEGDAAHPDNIAWLRANLFGRPGSGNTPAVKGVLPALASTLTTLGQQLNELRADVASLQVAAGEPNALANTLEALVTRIRVALEPGTTTAGTLTSDAPADPTQVGGSK
jgi:Domain of unknown function (DUF1906)